MMFGEVVSQIVLTFFPKYFKLVLANTVSYPIEAHVNGFGAFLFDCVIYNAIGCSIVSLDWGGRLGVTEKFECCAQGTGILSIVKESANFGFCGRRHDIVHNSADDVNGTIEHGRRGVFIGGGAFVA